MPACRLRDSGCRDGGYGGEEEPEGAEEDEGAANRPVGVGDGASQVQAQGAPEEARAEAGEGHVSEVSRGSALTGQRAAGARSADQEQAAAMEACPG